jgi:hypothetical protein
MSMSLGIEAALAELTQVLAAEGGVVSIRISIPQPQPRVEPTDSQSDGFGNAESKDAALDDDSEKFIGGMSPGRVMPMLMPNLGCAETRQLLEELAARMDDTQNSLAGRKLGKMCREALDYLSPGVLAYMTYHS